VTPAADEGREGDGNVSITYSCYFYDTKYSFGLVHVLTRPVMPRPRPKILALRPRSKPWTNITANNALHDYLPQHVRFVVIFSCILNLILGFYSNSNQSIINRIRLVGSINRLEWHVNYNNLHI
jgi:hypothetical protein